MIQIFNQKEVCLAFPNEWEWLKNIYISLKDIGFSSIGATLRYCGNKNVNPDFKYAAKEEDGRKNWYFVLDIDIEGKKMQILNYPLNIQIEVEEKQYLSILNEIKAQKK